MGRLVRYDLKHGCLFRWKKYAAAAVFTVFSCLSFYIQYKDQVRNGSFYFGDYLFWNFRGMRVIRETHIFVMPNGYWLGLNLFLAVLTGSYPVSELQGVGQQRLMRIKKRAGWWYSKCIWCLTSVLIFYLVVASAVGLPAALTGGFGIAQAQTVEKLGGTAFSTAGAFWGCFGIILLTSLAVCFVQMLISLVFGPKLGYVATALILMLAVYSKGGFSLENGLMFLRLSNPGVSGTAGVCVAVLLFTGTVVAGVFAIKKKDVCDKQAV